LHRDGAGERFDDARELDQYAVAAPRCWPRPPPSGGCSRRRRRQEWPRAGARPALRSALPSPADSKFESARAVAADQPASNCSLPYKAMTVMGPACVEASRDLRPWRIPPEAKLA
jgi:hypothetical protein